MPSDALGLTLISQATRTCLSLSFCFFRLFTGAPLEEAGKQTGPTGDQHKTCCSDVAAVLCLCSVKISEVCHLPKTPKLSCC